MTREFQALYDKAHAAGMAAGAAAMPTPMIVGSPSTFLGNDVDPTKPVYYVSEGVCGFAWVTFKGNTKWGAWAKKNGASKAYPSGLWYWVSDFGQSMTRNEAYASAFAKVLNENGITAYANSRMD